MTDKKVYWGVFFVAMATLVWEVLLTRIFSATMYYHFVFISISLAMLGFGCSGVFVFLFPRLFSRERCAAQLAVFSGLFAAAIVGAILVYLQIEVPMQPSKKAFLILTGILFCIFLPYLFSGFTITLALKHYARKVSTLYCFDLVGAGLGCVAVIGLLFVYDGLSLVFLTAGIAALGSVVFSTGGLPRMYRTVSLFCLLLLMSAFLVNSYGYRFLRVTSVQGDAQDDIIFEKWNPINRVTVTPDNFMGHESLMIKYDASATAHMHPFDGDTTAFDYLQSTIQSFYYQIRKSADVLIIGVGGGQDVLNAYISGQQTITGIEINPTIARLNTDLYRNFNGDLFHRDGVQLIVDEGRNFVRHTDDRFDIIHLPNVDSGVASSSGAFTFVENSLYTVEAFTDYYHCLKDDGVLWVSRWRTPNRKFYLENFRILTGVVTALEQLGVQHPEQHIVMLEEPYRVAWQQAIFLMKKTPFSSAEIASIEALRKKMNLQWIHHPQRRIDNVVDDYIRAADRNAFLREYPFRVDPNTDNNPFFFNFLKPAHYLGTLPEVTTHFSYPVFMFKSLLVIVCAMVLATILLPLLFFYRKGGGHDQPVRFRAGYILFFMCVGLGFMLVEIPLIQRFILFLGQPLYAIAVILSSLLIFSGIGSMLAGTFPRPATLSRLRLVLCLICGAVAAAIAGLPAIFETFLGIAEAPRVVVSILLIAPLGLLMGMAFPLGIQLLEHDGPGMIPWVWGINGACSVLGSIVAWGLSLNFGYNFTLAAAIAVYGCAAGGMMLKNDSVMQRT